MPFPPLSAPGPFPPTPSNPNQLSGRFTDFVFFQPEVLAADSTLAPAIRKQAGTGAAGGGGVVVVLQASDALARALQAQDFMVGAWLWGLFQNRAVWGTAQGWSQ